MHVKGIAVSLEGVEPGTEKNRLFWRSRRGLLELDLLLVPFVRECFDELSEESRRAYAELLDFDDVDIYDWIQGRSAPQRASLRAIVHRIRRHVDNRR